MVELPDEPTFPEGRYKALRIRQLGQNTKFLPQEDITSYFTVSIQLQSAS